MVSRGIDQAVRTDATHRVNGGPPRCRYCHAPLDPTLAILLGPEAFARRRYCNRACMAAAQRQAPRCDGCGVLRPLPGHRCRRTLLTPPARFPGAQADTLADLPATCDRDGGPWVRMPGGVRCLTCPRAVYVVAELRRALLRGRQ